jgi:hypothetical protein
MVCFACLQYNRLYQPIEFDQIMGAIGNCFPNINLLNVRNISQRHFPKKARVGKTLCLVKKYCVYFGGPGLRLVKKQCKEKGS